LHISLPVDVFISSNSDSSAFITPEYLHDSVVVLHFPKVNILM